MTANKVRLIIFCWICVSVSWEQVNQQCTPLNYPAFFDLTIDPPLFQLSFGPTGQVLIGSYHFGCNGIVTQIEFFCQNRGSLTAEFHVWRLDPSVAGATVYNLVGKHVLEDTRPDENNLLSYSPPEDERIRVQPGDIVGIRGYNATEPNPFVIQGHFQLGADVTMYTLSENEPTPTVLNLNDVSPVPAQIGLPVMRLTVTEVVELEVQTTETSQLTTISVSASTTATESSATESPNSLATPVIVAIAVSVGVVLIVLISVTIVVSSCCIIAHKRRQPVTDTTNNTTDEVVNRMRASTFTQPNVAYNRGNGPPYNSNNTNLNYHPYDNDDESVVYDYII